MPLGIFKTTKADPKALKYPFSYSPLVLWWPTLSHFKEKGYFSWPSDGLFCIFVKLPITSFTLKLGDAVMQSPVYVLLKHTLTAPTALESIFEAAVAWQGVRRGMLGHVLMHGSLQEAKRKTRRFTWAGVAVGVNPHPAGLTCPVPLRAGCGRSLLPH